MKPFPYRVLTEYSAEDKCYVARVPAFEGVAAHGDTIEEACHEAQVAAEGVLLSLKPHRHPIPAPDGSADFSGQLRLRLPRSAHARLSRVAEAEQVSLNQLLVALISEGLGRRTA